jgi:glycosyltransferase involved in cell wall biosynthesis
MRVAVISDMVRPNGAGVMALVGARLLAEAGHDVTVLAGAMSADLERQLAGQGGAAAFTNDERALDGSVTESDHLAFRRAVKVWLEAELQQWVPDALYVHNCGRILEQLDLADLSCRYPVVHTMHDEWFISDAHYTFRSPRDGETVRTFEPGRSEHVLEHRYDHLFDVPTRVGAFTAIAPSKWLADRARRVFPTLDVLQLNNAVDHNFFALQDRKSCRDMLGLPNDRSIVLFVGSPTQERKGFDLFERAMRTVDVGGEKPVRMIAGGSASVVTDGFAGSLSAGPIAENLAVLPMSPLGAIGVDGDALVVSGLDRSLVPALYGAADVLVHPSIIDNLPTVPIEAGLCGTRCLASDVGGTRETIADTSDLFSIDAGPNEIGRRISTALSDAKRETSEDCQLRRDAQLERFSIDQHRDTLVSMFDGVIGRANP